MSEIKILKCPFCGGEAKLRKKNRIIVEGKTERECHVYCTVCNARAERVLYKNCDSTEMAHEIAKQIWNTRKPMQNIVERLEEELELTDKEKRRCVHENPLQFDEAKGYARGIANAIEIVREEGGLNE